MNPNLLNKLKAPWLWVLIVKAQRDLANSQSDNWEMLRGTELQTLWGKSLNIERST